MKISDTLLDLVTTLRDVLQQDGDDTTTLAQELAKLPDFEGSVATAGYHITPEGDIVNNHWWLVMDDGSIFDANGDAPVRCSKKDKRHGRYFPYAGDAGVPIEVLQMADHLRAASRIAKNKSFAEMVAEASGAAPSAVARQAPSAMPDDMTMDGREGVPAEDFDDETMPEDLRLGWKDLDEDYEDYEEYQPEDYMIPAGTILYHGTSAEDWNEAEEDIEPPFWVTENEYDAQFFVTWNGQQGRARMLIFRNTQPLRLVLFRNRDDMEEFSEYTGIDMQSPREAAEDMCDHGFDGWIVPGNYQYGGSDIMLCSSADIEYVGTEDVDIKEVDHPDYMPGGESGSDGHDPTYDERSVQANPGWPKP